MYSMIGIAVAFGALAFWLEVLDDINAAFIAAISTVLLLGGVAFLGIWIFT